MDKNTNSKKGLLYALYIVIGIYVAIMYLLYAFRDIDRSYMVMMNLSIVAIIGITLNQSLLSSFGMK